MAPTSRHLGDKHGAIALALVVYEVGNQKPLDAEILMKYFRLTPAEARISIGLASGLALKLVADENLVAISTARSQLKSIYLKTDTNSQSVLVSLIGSFPPASE